MRRILIWLVAGMFLLCFTGFLYAEEPAADKGSEIITFEKIKMNQVMFPHHLHQKALENNCNACHDLFPQKPGIIRELITQEKLKHQQVMNGKCIACHKTNIAAGKKAGPVKCTECHVRPL